MKNLSILLLLIFWQSHAFAEKTNLRRITRFKTEFKVPETLADTVKNLNDSGPGSLRDVISLASEQDTIVFDPSLIANGSDTIKLNSVITIDKNLYIHGLINGGDSLYISGQNSSPIFNIPAHPYFTDRTTTIDDLVFINGKNSGWGAGAISYFGTGSLTINNCLFKENSGSNAGAIYTIGFGFKLSNSTISNNYSATNGGGLDCEGSNDPIIENCIITSNKCENDGGGLYCFQMKEITDCIITKNSANNSGGGIYSYDITKIINCTVSQNESAAEGGGIAANFIEFIDNSILENNNAQLKGGGINSLNIDLIKNSIIYNNSAQLSGGGIFIGDNINEIRNSKIIGNKSNENGGGIYFDIALTQIYNTIISENRAALKGGGMYLRYGYSIDLTSTILFGNMASDGGAIFNNADSLSNSTVGVKNSTIYKNYAGATGGIYSPSVYALSSIIAENTNQNITVVDTQYGPGLYSAGYNIFSNAPNNAVASDQVNISTSQLQLIPVMEGGEPTGILMPSGVALNLGNPADFSDALNGPIVDSRRDVGAVESFSTLSVDLLGFSANLKDEKTVFLAWNTANESAFSHFEVERSGDGYSFERIGQVNSNSKQNKNKYSFEDRSISNLDLMAYYRLKMVDLDGGFNYSPIKLVDLNNLRVRVYPNPFNEILSITTNSKSASVNISDLNGLSIYHSTFEPNKNPLNIDLKDLGKGLYFINVKTETESRSFKIIKE